MDTPTITLLIYLVILLPLMLLGFIFARRKNFTVHKMVMTSVVILNWILIAYVMAGSYRNGVLPGIPDSMSDIRIWLPMTHGIIGLIAQIVASYLVLLMWTENTALEKLVFFRIKNIKTPMRVTLTMWIITVLMGIGIYATWYGGTAEVDAENVSPPATTEEAEVIDDSDLDDDEVPSPATTEDADDDDDDDDD